MNSCVMLIGAGAKAAVCPRLRLPCGPTMPGLGEHASGLPSVPLHYILCIQCGMPSCRLRHTRGMSIAGLWARATLLCVLHCHACRLGHGWRSDVCSRCALRAPPQSVGAPAPAFGEVGGAKLVRALVCAFPCLPGPEAAQRARPWLLGSGCHRPSTSRPTGPSQTHTPWYLWS